MKLPILTWTTTTKIAAGAIGALAAGGVAVGATAAVAHVITPTSPPPAITNPSPPPSPGGQRGAGANPVARATRQALLQAEAQILGVAPKQLAADLAQGQTVHQLADQKGISQADFQTKLTTDMKPMLDHDVQQGTLTGAQEQVILQRVGQTIPNWDQPARQLKRSLPDATPAPQPAATPQGL